MRAVLLATGYRQELLPLIYSRPTPLLRILDRPIIELIIEFLVNQKIVEFDIVLSHLPELIENRLGEGRRWGAKFTYHLAKEGQHPFSLICHLVQGWEEKSFLLARTDTLPLFSYEELHQQFMKTHMPSLLFYPSKVWTGWGIFPITSFHAIPKEITEDNLDAHFSPIQYKVVKAQPFLSVRSFLDLLKSNQKMIGRKVSRSSSPFLLRSTANMVEPGVWISRAATIHPTAKIRAPVFIGEECQIKAFAQVGPNAIIENNSVIDRQSIVENSLICQRSYIGEGLEIRNCIIDKNELMNLTLETQVMIENDFILAELKTPSFHQYVLRSLGKYFAFFLILLLSPFFGWFYLTRYVHRYPVLALPASHLRLHWKTFDLLYFGKKPQTPLSHPPSGIFASLPKLINILNGELHFTGVRPRTIEEVEKLPADWQRIYLNANAGLITLAMVEQGPNPSPDNLYASEAYYVANTGLWYDLKLCWRWFKKKILRFK